jgi:hypothetical protein
MIKILHYLPLFRVKKRLFFCQKKLRKNFKNHNIGALLLANKRQRLSNSLFLVMGQLVRKRLATKQRFQKSTVAISRPPIKRVRQPGLPDGIFSNQKSQFG